MKRAACMCVVCMLSGDFVLCFYNIFISFSLSEYFSSFVLTFLIHPRRKTMWLKIKKKLMHEIVIDMHYANIDHAPESRRGRGSSFNALSTISPWLKQFQWNISFHVCISVRSTENCRNNAAKLPFSIHIITRGST